MCGRDWCVFFVAYTLTLRIHAKCLAQRASSAGQLGPRGVANHRSRGRGAVPDVSRR